MFKVVFSNNDFVVHQGETGGLSVLHGLKPVNIAALTGLVVCLDLTRPVTPRLCCTPSWGDNNCVDHCRGPSRSPQEVNIRKWHDALTYVLPHLPRQNFCLHLICDLQWAPCDVARNIAKRLLAPLENRRTLPACSVKLGPHPNMELRSMAKALADRATGVSLPMGQFRLLDLPQELRSQILGYTDLIAERKEVEWRPGQGYWTSSNGICDELWSEERPGGGFCRRKHAAFGRNCECWLSPLPLFLTCRSLRFEAEQVFFQKNRIVVRPVAGTNNWMQQTPPTLEVSDYLTRVIPEHALCHLRSLELVFPPFKGAFLQSNEPAYRDWLTVLENVKKKLNCSRLALRVCFAAKAPGHISYRPCNEPDPTDKRAEQIFESYRRTLLPLSVLRDHGLRSFYIDLTSPFWFHMDMQIQNSEHEDRRRKMWADQVKSEIEQKVMGNGYCPTSSDDMDSLWKLRWIDMVFFDGCEVEYDDALMPDIGL